MPEDTLVSINNTYLTRSDLDKQIPGGLSEEDSTKLAWAYINAWINSQLLSQIAVKEIDTKEIDKMVEQYRNDLIIWEYTKQMFDSHNDTEIPEDSLRAYYDQHKDEFVLSRPMVQGVYLKVASDAKSLPELRKIYRSKKNSDIDNLDKSMLNGAIHYDYFRDKWIDWEQIESRIPMDFGPSADSFLRHNKSIDFSHGGFTYLLDISQVLYTGNIMPFEAAKPQISDRINFYNRRKYEEKLRKDLLNKALTSQQLKIMCETGTNKKTSE